MHTFILVFIAPVAVMLTIAVGLTILTKWEIARDYRRVLKSMGE